MMSFSAIQMYDHLYVQLQRNKLLQIFSFKIFLNYWKAVLCPLSQTRKQKKTFDVICCLYKMKQSHCCYA